jgi:hypothetical protein
VVLPVEANEAKLWDTLRRVVMAIAAVASGSAEYLGRVNSNCYSKNSQLGFRFF